jgi:glucose-1-phosphatase
MLGKLNPQTIALLDLEGVVYDIDYQKTFDAFNRLPYKTKELTWDKTFGEKTALYDRGEISTREIFTWLSEKYFNRQLDFDEFKLCWNAMIIDIKEENFEYLVNLSRQHHLILFSNINELHWKAVTKAHPTLFKWGFSDLYLSYKMKLAKPAPKAFEVVIQALKNKYPLCNIIFVDDTKGNIEQAEKMGLYAITFPTNGGKAPDQITLGQFFIKREETQKNPFSKKQIGIPIGVINNFKM